MGKATPHRLTDEVVILGRALRNSERAAVAGALRRLLAWQSSLRGWPALRTAPQATPYVSLYARGKLRGCYGSHEGAPTERVVRAFLLALADARYGGVPPHERTELAASVAYLTHARPVRADEATTIIEPGTHGVALSDGSRSTVLLPSVARERGYDADGVLELLAHKAARPRSSEGIIWVLEVEEISSRGVHERDSTHAAKRFLETLVAHDGSVAFEMDASSGETRPSGVMRHGRIAVAVEALVAMGSTKARRASKWLAREIERGLAGRGVEGWPERRDMILGTLALAARSGCDVPLATYAESIDTKACSPWHAAQAASVLGGRTPRGLWTLCERSLETRPLSPYTLLAACKRGDGPVIERCAHALVASIRERAPFEGGAELTPVPETALTAVTVEALSPLRGADVRRAVLAARRFVLARQVLDVPPSMHPRALGAFRASPIAPILRCDVTGHATLAALHR